MKEGKLYLLLDIVDINYGELEEIIQLPYKAMSLVLPPS